MREHVVQVALIHISTTMFTSAVFFSFWVYFFVSYEAISSMQLAGYYILIGVCTVNLFIIGPITFHVLKVEMGDPWCFRIILFCYLILCLLSTLPTPFLSNLWGKGESTKEYIKNFNYVNGRPPYLMDYIHRAKHCCGYASYTDYYRGDKVEADSDAPLLEPVPRSCCSHMSLGCERSPDLIYKTGCFVTADSKEPSAWEHPYHGTGFFPVILLPLILPLLHILLICFLHDAFALIVERQGYEQEEKDLDLDEEEKEYAGGGDVGSASPDTIHINSHENHNNHNNHKRSISEPSSYSSYDSSIASGASVTSRSSRKPIKIIGKPKKSPSPKKKKKPFFDKIADFFTKHTPHMNPSSNQHDETLQQYLRTRHNSQESRNSNNSQYDPSLYQNFNQFDYQHQEQQAPNHSGGQPIQATGSEVRVNEHVEVDIPETTQHRIEDLDRHIKEAIHTLEHQADLHHHHETHHHSDHHPTHHHHEHGHGHGPHHHNDHRHHAQHHGGHHSGEHHHHGGHHPQPQHHHEGHHGGHHHHQEHHGAHHHAHGHHDTAHRHHH